MASHWLGVDTGGTFTDFVCIDGDQRVRIHKVLSTPQAPEQAILQGIDELGLAPAVAAGEVAIVHGSTVATNAALERKGVHTLYVTNAGLEDVLTLGRQARPALYDLNPPLTPPPVAADDCLGVPARLAADGSEVTPLTWAAIAELVERARARAPAAVAINLLFSYQDPSQEQRLEAALRAALPQAFISRSSFVLPALREYERGIATWLNAYLGPKVQHYLQRLQAGTDPAPLAVMQSAGGTIDAAQAGQRAVNLLLSGPAGGLAAARYIGQMIGVDRLLTFDMGGTSTDVALIDGDIALTDEGRLGPFPVAVPMVDMHTIGAGGGSLAYRDAGGLLQVGPESAGADPGPACYGNGGTQPTVTDANLVLGRLRPELFLGGGMALDGGAAERAVAALAETLELTPLAAAEGIVTLANEHMARALRVISVQRGHDPQAFELCCFGGAGGLHLCALAEALGMDRALVPVHGGVLSALGMLVAPRERQLVQTHTTLLTEVDAADIDSWLERLAEQGRAALGAEGVAADTLNQRATVDLRYRGQSFSFPLPWQRDLDALAEAFHRAHAARYGHALELPVELVNLKVTVSAAPPPLQLPEWPADHCAPLLHADLPGLGETAIYRREELGREQVIVGPALIAERVATTLVASGWQARVDRWGNIRLRRQ